jgi:tryptophanyl-tRNA synthetase
MRVFSGIQATGAKHIGNYIGAMRQYVTTQEEGDAFFCIVDLHSITVDYDPKDLHDRSLDLAALLFAVGLHPDRSTLFLQSHVAAHPEAAWLLSAVTGFGQLGRMTQFKEKGEGKEFVSAGLFTYPVLMAGDILLYQTDLVPVGDDQRQHVEPEVGARIMDLQEPTNKMSTTGGTSQGTVLVLDSPDTIRKKFKTAVTDSGREVRYAPEEQPGVSNLVEILSVSTGRTLAEVERAYDGRGYGDLKSDVGEAVVELFAPVQARYAELRADEGELRRLLRVGAEKARETSAPTLQKMYERMGFVAP